MRIAYNTSMLIFYIGKNNSNVTDEYDDLLFQCVLDKLGTG